MTDATAEPEEEPKKKGGMLPLLIGAVLAVVAGGGGFFVASSGLLGGGSEAEEKEEKKNPADAIAKAAFVPLEPLIVSISTDGRSRQLRFKAQLEVEDGTEKAVQEIMPRITDVLNGYLRAVEVSELEDPSVLVRLRAQMLRRVQIVVGEGVVNDLLVTEFVLN